MQQAGFEPAPIGRFYKETTPKPRMLYQLSYCCILTVTRRAITIKAAAQGTDGHHKQETEEDSQQAEPDKGRQKILHGCIDKAVNVDQIRDTMGD